MSDTAGSRLREERERLGMSQRAMGEAGGVSKNTHLAYEGGSSIPLDYLERLEAHGLDVGYVALGSRAEGANEQRRSYRHEPPQRSDDVEIAEVDLRYGLGATYMDGSVETKPRSFSRAWLRNFTASSPDELFWALGDGDSMEPTIRSGEVVLIDRSQNSPHMGEGIWALAWGEVGLIKRVRPLPDGTIELHSDNQLVRPISASDGEVHIIGRVVAVVRKL